MTLHDGPASVKYDVAVSFAGEDRGLVEAVVTQLKRSGVKVFYDVDLAVDMWGNDLIEYFDRIYRTESRYVIIFVSRHYKTKMWPRHERRSALARGLEQSEPYVLPIRIDDTVLDGLRPTVGYLDARQMAPADIAAAVSAKLSTTPVKPHEADLPARGFAGGRNRKIFLALAALMTVVIVANVLINRSDDESPTITLRQGSPAPHGYWYDVSLSGFTPGSSVQLQCDDSVDPNGFFWQTFSIDGNGNAGDTTLCYSGDHPDHWVTGGGVESNHISW